MRELLNYAMELSTTEILLIVNGVLFGIVAYLLNLGINKVGDALKKVEQLQITQAVNSEAIQRHERWIERQMAREELLAGSTFTHHGDRDQPRTGG